MPNKLRVSFTIYCVCDARRLYAFSRFLLSHDSVLYVNLIYYMHRSFFDAVFDLTTHFIKTAISQCQFNLHDENHIISSSMFRNKLHFFLLRRKNRTHKYANMCEAMHELRENICGASRRRSERKSARERAREKEKSSGKSHNYNLDVN